MSPSPSRSALTVTTGDFATASALMVEAATWLASIGQPLWKPEQLTPEKLAASAQPHEVVVGHIHNTPAVAMLLQSTDPLFWPGVTDALFIHKLSVARRFAGQGIAAALIDWAVGQARAAGKTHLRLDCAADRPKLLAVYERADFRFVDHRKLGPFTVARFERPV